MCESMDTSTLMNANGVWLLAGGGEDHQRAYMYEYPDGSWRGLLEEVWIMGSLV